VSFVKSVGFESNVDITSLTTHLILGCRSKHGHHRLRTSCHVSCLFGPHHEKHSRMPLVSDSHRHGSTTPTNLQSLDDLHPSVIIHSLLVLSIGIAPRGTYCVTWTCIIIVNEYQFCLLAREQDSIYPLLLTLMVAKAFLRHVLAA
jgi:hypothetical protein